MQFLVSIIRLSLLLSLTITITLLCHCKSSSETDHTAQLIKAAEQGNAGAQFTLAELYSYGAGGLPKDELEAAKWYHRAAEQGDANAQFALKEYYESKIEGITNDAEAVKWCRKAAEQGHAQAQNALACDYTIGGHVPKDYIAAHMWFSLAAASGEKSAMENRERLARKMTQEQIVEAQKLSREWKPSITK